MSALTTPNNSKLKKLRIKYNLPHAILSFGMPAKRSCPKADKCAPYCFGEHGSYIWPVVANKYEWRFQESKKPEFTDKMVNQLNRKRSNHMRVHDIGDFYSQKYLSKWVNIWRHQSRMQFWFYTKSISLIKKNKDFIPSNVNYVYSFGGKEDHLIDTTKDRYSRTINPDEIEKYEAKGYINLTADELQINNLNHRKFFTVMH